MWSYQGLLKHREWRGLGDTLFDFGFWMKNRMAWGLIRALRREAFKKGDINGETLAEKHLTRNSGCVSCPIRCERRVKVDGKTG